MIVFGLSREETEDVNKRLASQLKADVDFAKDSHLTTPQVYSHRFPEWVWLQQPSRCKRIMEELLLMTSDSFQHRLTPLHEAVLYECMAEWANELEDRLADGGPAGEVGKMEAAQEYWANALDLLDSDIVQVEFIANRVLAVEVVDAALAAKATQYLQLMPFDVMHDVAAVLAKQPVDLAERR